MIRTTFVLTVLALLAMLAGGCASRTPSQALPAGVPQSALPPIPADIGRETSLITATTLNGKDAEQRSPGAVESGNHLSLLDADHDGTVEWAIWRFNPGSVPDHLEITFSPREDAWVGLANFAAGYWEFGPTVDTGNAPSLSLPVDPIKNVSPAGNIYVLVVSWEAYIESLSLLAAAKGWVNGGVSGRGALYESISMALVNGKPAVAYCPFNGDEKLLFAAGNDTVGYGWADTVIADDPGGGVAEMTSIADVNGSPAIAYSYQTENQLRFVRAGDPGGTAWEAPVIVDDEPGIGRPISKLLVVDGNPAIAFFDSGFPRDELCFVRANDPDGTTWGAPVVVDTGTNSVAGNSIDLDIVNGNPAITVYCRSSSGLVETLVLLRAADPDGATWAPAVEIAAAGAVWASLTIVEGLPACVYTDYIDVDDYFVKFVKAVDADGSSWNAPQQLFDASGVHDLSLSVINGLPAVGYSNWDEGSNGAVMYCQAEDAAGTVWGTPEAVDYSSGTDLPGTVTLLEVDGQPAMSYQIDDKLGYIRYYDGTL